MVTCALSDTGEKYYNWTNLELYSRKSSNGNTMGFSVHL